MKTESYNIKLRQLVFVKKKNLTSNTQARQVHDRTRGIVSCYPLVAEPILRTEKFCRNLVNPNQNLDCNYHFPINLAPIRIPIDTESVGKG